METKKIMATFAALMIALSAVGFAYAAWKDMVYIEGTVEMGDFLVGWLNITECYDIDLQWDVPKEVATLTCELEDPETGVHHIDPETGEPQTVYHTLVVTVENAYPQYEAWCKVDLKNAGTIPAHIVSVVLTPGAGLVISNTTFDANGNPVGWELTDTDTDLPALNVFVCKQETRLSLVCNQIDPCTAEPVDLWLEVKQEGCEMCNTYTFSFEIEAIQWNKAPVVG